MTPRPVFPLADARTVADDGDAASFCTTCAFSQRLSRRGRRQARARSNSTCWSTTSDRSTAGEHVFRKGDPFDAIAAVRAGTVKTYVIDADGNERVLGFHLPGEVIGLDGIDGQRYPCNAVALDTVMLCRFSFQRMSELAARLPGLQRQLFRLLSRDIGAAIRLGNDATADQRMAAFLLGLSQRLAARGFSATALPSHDAAHRHRQPPAPRAGDGEPRAQALPGRRARSTSTGARSNSPASRD